MSNIANRVLHLAVAMGGRCSITFPGNVFGKGDKHVLGTPSMTTTTKPNPILSASWGVLGAQTRFCGVLARLHKNPYFGPVSRT
jgi:hypothetical protein